MSLPINAETKIGALLEAYPAAEEALIAMAPGFQRLKNPVLRKTVAKVATLGQAARMGGVSVREMVSAVRAAAGVTDAHEPDPEIQHDSPAPPSWMSLSFIRHEIDGCAMLDAGIHPIGKVRECVAGLRTGEVVRLTSPFRPEPLIETMRRGGLQVFSRELEPGRHETFFGRAQCGIAGPGPQSES
jgi:hypothetical protein